MRIFLLFLFLTAAGFAVDSPAQRAGIRMTPTVVILDEANKEVFRAEGVPTINQVLVALAKAVP